jgi:hypothetical protein
MNSFLTFLGKRLSASCSGWRGWGVLLGIGLWGFLCITPAGAQAPLPTVELQLPQPALPVLDLANELNANQESLLSQKVLDLEAATGWKLRILTQFDQTPGRRVKEYWDLNDKSVLMVADPRGGNLLAFNVGDSVRQILPRTFWIELQSRFGNQFYVREQGGYQAILDTVNTLDYCFRQGGCRVVPGLPKEQWILTLITSIAGGIVLGFAGKPRQPEEIFNWRLALLLSPLWFILFGSFGIGPVITRTSDWLPLARNILGFAGAALVIYLAPLQTPMNSSPPSSS